MSQADNNAFKLKREFRKIRSNLKHKILHGGKVSAEIRAKYNLEAFNNPKYRKTKVKIKKRSTENWLPINVPKILCFLSDHDGTLRFLAELSEKLLRRKPYNLHLIHTNTEVIGLAASFIFDFLVEIYRIRWDDKGITIKVSGETGSNRQVNNFLLSFGFLSESKWDSDLPAGFVDKDYKDKFETLKFKGSSKASHLKSNAATELAAYFGRCYRHNNYLLSDDVMGNLADAFGEIIGNAEEHSSQNGNSVTWHAMGCYDKDRNFCRFAIVNYGNTIYYNLTREDSTLSDIISYVKDMINGQKSFLKRFKDKVLSKEEEEPLWNVMALQDGISSKRTKSGQSSTRGQGLMDVLNFISDLKANEDIAEVALISGRSKIIIDYTYPITRKSVGTQSEERRQIFFNKSRTFKEEQDPEKVVLMKAGFEGTIITGRFRINEKYISLIS